MEIKNIIFLALLFICGGAAFANAKSFDIPRSEIISIKDSKSGRTYGLHIQMPVDYDKNKKYAVVYMTDSEYTFPIVTGAARYPINFKKIENVMFVGVSWESGVPGSLSRQRDYTPTKDAVRFKDPSGDASTHLNFFKNDVIPYIENRFSTDPSRRTYVGNSFGGLFGAYILLSDPQMFKNYILGSPSLWWDNGYIFKLEKSAKNLHQNVAAKVFIAVGEQENINAENTKNDIVVQAKKFHQQLVLRNIKNLSLELRVIEGANHYTAFPSVAAQGLWWLFKINKR